MQQELARFAVEITRTTLVDWVAAVATVLEPLYRLVRDDLITGSYLRFDEAPVRVMDPEVDGRTATGWLWDCSVHDSSGARKLLGSSGVGSFHWLYRGWTVDP